MGRKKTWREPRGISSTFSTLEIQRKTTSTTPRNISRHSCRTSTLKPSSPALHHPNTVAACTLAAERESLHRGIVVCRWRATTAGRVSKQRGAIIHVFVAIGVNGAYRGNGAQQPAYRPAPTFKSRSTWQFHGAAPVGRGSCFRASMAPSVWLSTIAGFARDWNVKPCRII